MGCGGSRLTSDDSINEVISNPAKGLPHLLAPLQHPKATDAKAMIPKIIEILPQAMKSLRAESPKALVSACAVIECCVRLHNEAGVAINGTHLKQCQLQLGAMLKSCQKQAEEVYSKEFFLDVNSSSKVKAIALATAALFKLDIHGMDCKIEMNKAGGIQAAVLCLKASSGIMSETHPAIVQMLCSYVGQDFKSVENIAAHKEVLVSFLETKSLCDATRNSCQTVLDACMEFSILDQDKQMSLSWSISSKKKRASMSLQDGDKA